MARPLARARARFFEILSRHGNLTEASRGSGLARSHALSLRDSDADFAAAWEAAVAEAVDGLEAEAWRRAVEGEACPVFYKGEQVGVRHRRSDRLLMFLLRGLRPRRYGAAAGRPARDGDGDSDAADADIEFIVGELVIPPGPDGTAPGPDCRANGRPIRYQRIEAEEPGSGRTLTVGFAPDHPELTDLWEERIREWLGGRQASREGWAGRYWSRMSEIDAAKRAGRPPPPPPTRPPGLKPRDGE